MKWKDTRDKVELTPIDLKLNILFRFQGQIIHLVDYGIYSKIIINKGLSSRTDGNLPIEREEELSFFFLSDGEAGVILAIPKCSASENKNKRFRKKS
jgi:hypothetical protein